MALLHINGSLEREQRLQLLVTDFFSYVGLFFLFFLLPIAQGFVITYWVSAFKLPLFIVAICFILSGFRLQKIRRLRGTIFIPLFLLIILMLVSPFFLSSIPIDAGIQSTIKFGLFLIQSIFILSFVKRKNALTVAAIAYISSVIFFYGTATFFGWWPQHKPISPEGRLALTIFYNAKAGLAGMANQNRNVGVLTASMIGYHTGTSFWLLLYLFLRYKSILSKFFLAVLMVMCGIIIVAASSRQGFVGLITSVLIVFRKHFSSKIFILSVVVGGISVLASFILFPEGNPLVERFLSNDSVIGVIVRLYPSIDAVKYVFIEGNLLGAGISGSFKGKYGLSTMFVPHCMPFAMLGDFGILGLAVYCYIWLQIYLQSKKVPPSLEKTICVGIVTFVFVIMMFRGGGYYEGWTWIMLPFCSSMFYFLSRNPVREGSRKRLALKSSFS